MSRASSIVVGIGVLLSLRTAQARDERSPRRVWVDFVSGDRSAGIAVAADAVWVRGATSDGRRVCLEAGPCTPVVATLSRTEIPAPGWGRILMLETRLVSVTPWPSGDDEGAELVEDLRRDPLLKPLLDKYRAPVKVPVSFGLSTSISAAHMEPDYRWEISLLGGSIARRHGDAVATGFEANFGITFGADCEHPSEPMFGDSLGVASQLAFYPWATVSPAGQDEGLWSFSLSPELANIIDPFTRSRLRIPSLLGAVTPELGWMAHPNWNSGFVRWQFPVALLVSYSWGLQMRPSVGVLYVDPRGRADWFYGISLGPFLRIDGPSSRNYPW